MKTVLATLGLALLLVAVVPVPTAAADHPCMPGQPSPHPCAPEPVDDVIELYRCLNGSGPCPL